MPDHLRGLQSETYFSRRLLTTLAAGVWFSAIAFSLISQYQESQDSYLDLGQVRARNAFQKDLSFRRWSNSHGGVYVPVDSNTPPNPYLAEIPERDLKAPSGRSLTLMNPAYMMRQVYSMRDTDSQASGHITSLKPLRPENAPDPWERKALEAFAKGEKSLKP